MYTDETIYLSPLNHKLTIKMTVISQIAGISLANLLLTSNQSNQSPTKQVHSPQDHQPE